METEVDLLEYVDKYVDGDERLNELTSGAVRNSSTRSDIIFGRRHMRDTDMENRSIEQREKKDSGSRRGRVEVGVRIGRIGSLASV